MKKGDFVIIVKPVYTYEARMKGRIGILKNKPSKKEYGEIQIIESNGMSYNCIVDFDGYVECSDLVKELF